MTEKGEAFLSRAALYDLVWRIPMGRLGAWLGLGGHAGLERALREADIPRPDPGHWMRVQHGKPIRREPLPHPDRSENPAVYMSRERLQRILEELHSGGDFSAAPPEWRTDWELFEADPANQIVVPEHIDQWHPLVAGVKDSLRGVTYGLDGRLTLHRGAARYLCVSEACLDRALRIMNALVCAMERRGLVPLAADANVKRARVVVQGGEFSFGIEEECHKGMLPPSPLTERERRLKLTPPAQYGRIPSGRLSLRLYGNYNWLVGKVEDGKIRRVEGCLNRFILLLHHKAIQCREERTRREEEERIRLAQEQHRANIRKAQEEELKRVAFLENDAASWQKSETIRRYIHARREAALRNGEDASPGSEMARWVEWASSCADRLDPLVVSPPSILDEKVDTPKYSWMTHT